MGGARLGHHWTLAFDTQEAGGFQPESLRYQPVASIRGRSGGTVLGPEDGAVQLQAEARDIHSRLRVQISYPRVLIKHRVHGETFKISVQYGDPPQH